MRFRILWLGSAAILALLAAYYAGYRRGIHRTLASTKVVAASGGESDRLRDAPPLALDLALPIYGVRQSEITDTFDQARSGGKRHEATDIMAPRGTPVHAVQDGTIRKLFLSRAGGNTIYEFDPEGIYCFYYAHLDRYAEALREGMPVKKGDVIAYVGSTGDAAREAPHLHFAIVKLGPDKKWWEGTAINPFPILVRLASR